MFKSKNFDLKNTNIHQLCSNKYPTKKMQFCFNPKKKKRAYPYFFINPSLNQIMFLSCKILPKYHHHISQYYRLLNKKGIFFSRRWCAFIFFHPISICSSSCIYQHYVSWMFFNENPIILTKRWVSNQINFFKAMLFLSIISAIFFFVPLCSLHNIILIIQYLSVYGWMSEWMGKSATRKRKNLLLRAVEQKWKSTITSQYFPFLFFSVIKRQIFIFFLIIIFFCLHFLLMKPNPL